MANTIQLQKWGIVVQLDLIQYIPAIDEIHDVLYREVEYIHMVEGPLINGALGITVWCEGFNGLEDAKSQIQEALTTIGILFSETK